MKPGQRTTEFLVTLTLCVGVAAPAVGGELSPRYAAIAASISVAAYAISRGLAKIGKP